MRSKVLIALAALYLTLAQQVSLGVDGERGRHTNNWAILVDTSRYWFNYRVS